MSALDKINLNALPDPIPGMILSYMYGTDLKVAALRNRLCMDLSYKEDLDHIRQMPRNCFMRAAIEGKPQNGKLVRKVKQAAAKIIFTQRELLKREDWQLASLDPYAHFADWTVANMQKMVSQIIEKRTEHTLDFFKALRNSENIERPFKINQTIGAKVDQLSSPREKEKVIYAWLQTFMPQSISDAPQAFNEFPPFAQVLMLAFVNRASAVIEKMLQSKEFNRLSTLCIGMLIGLAMNNKDLLLLKLLASNNRCKEKLLTMPVERFSELLLLAAENNDPLLLEKICNSLFTDPDFSLGLANQPNTEKALRAAQAHESRFLPQLELLLELRR